jgi:hypothetical protein
MLKTIFNAFLIAFNNKLQVYIKNNKKFSIIFNI